MSSTPSYDEAKMSLETLNDKLTYLAEKYDPQKSGKAIPTGDIESIRNNADKIADFLKTASEEEQVKFIAQAMDKYDAVQLLNKLNLMLALEELAHKKDDPSNNELLKEVESTKVFNKIFESMTDIIETFPAQVKKAEDLNERSLIIAKIDNGELSQEWLVHQIKEASAKSNSVATEKYTSIYEEKFGEFKPEEHKQQLTTEQQEQIQSMDKQMPPKPTEESFKQKEQLLLQFALMSKIPPENMKQASEIIKDVKINENDPKRKEKLLIKDILSKPQEAFAIAQKNSQLPPAPPTPEQEKVATQKQKRAPAPKPQPKSGPKEPEGMPSPEVFAQKSAVNTQIEEMSQKKKNDDANIKPSEISQEHANVKPQPNPNNPPPPPTVEVVEKKQVTPSQPHNENIGTTPSKETRAVVKTVVVAATALAATAQDGVMSARNRLSEYLKPSNDNSMKPRPQNNDK